MSAIKELTKGCRTIVAVIHQPASETFELFDKLCLLSAGSPIFFGDAAAGADFFAAAGRPVPPRRSAPDREFSCVLGRPVEAENILETNEPTNQPTTH